MNWILLTGAAVLAYFFGKKPIEAAATEAVQTVQDQVTIHSDYFTDHDALFMKYGAIYAVPWWRLKAICMNESSLGTAPSVKRGLENPSDVEGSKSDDGKSWGPMQMTLTTAADFDPAVTAEKLNDWDYSLELAAQLLNSLQDQFSDEEFVVKSYNQGAGNSRKEMAGKIAGYAGEYWARYQRNRQLIKDRQGV